MNFKSCLFVLVLSPFFCVELLAQNDELLPPLVISSSLNPTPDSKPVYGCFTDNYEGRPGISAVMIHHTSLIPKALTHQNKPKYYYETAYILSREKLQNDALIFTNTLIKTTDHSYAQVLQTWHPSNRVIRKISRKKRSTIEINTEEKLDYAWLVRVSDRDKTKVIATQVFHSEKRLTLIGFRCSYDPNEVIGWIKTVLEGWK